MDMVTTKPVLTASPVANVTDITAIEQQQWLNLEVAPAVSPPATPLRRVLRAIGRDCQVRSTEYLDDTTAPYGGE